MHSTCWPGHRIQSHNLRTYFLEILYVTVSQTAVFYCVYFFRSGPNIGAIWIWIRFLYLGGTLEFTFSAAYNLLGDIVLH